MLIYKPEIWYLDQPLSKENLHKPSATWELHISHTYPKFYSTKEKALGALKELYNSHVSDLEANEYEKVYQIQITTEYVDDNKGGCSYEYDNHFNLIKKHDWEKDEEFLGNDNPKYNIGDWVLVFNGHYLSLGRVGALPMSTKEKNKKYPNQRLDQFDNVYYVVEANYNEKDTYPHSHPNEESIYSKVEIGDLEKYYPLELLEELNEKYNEYIDYQNKRKK